MEGFMLEEEAERTPDAPDLAVVVTAPAEDAWAVDVGRRIQHNFNI